MNKRKAIGTAVRVGGFFARHLLALGVLVAVPCVLWTVAYFLLLVVAMVTNEAFGHPILFPLMFAFLFAVALAFGIFVCLPITSVAEWIARRKGWPILVQLPLSVGGLGLLLLMGVVAAVATDPADPSGGIVMWMAGFVVSIVPFCCYWGAVQAFPLVLAGLRWARGFFAGKDGKRAFADYPRRPSQDGTTSFRALR